MINSASNQTDAGRQCLIDRASSTLSGSKTVFFLSGGDLWEDPQWLAQLITTTANELPLPKPKVKKK